MASIRKRVYASGITKYQVRINVKGIPQFFQVFDTLKEAQDWLEENELLYIQNPENYTEYTHRRKKKLKTLKMMSILRYGRTDTDI